MILQTERLILREFTVDDLDALAVLLGNDEVMRFSLSGPLKEKAQVKEYLQTRILDHYVKHGFGLYAVIHKQDQRLIGYIGLLHQVIDGEEKVELGYRLHPNYWGQGLAAEGALAVCHYAFEKLHIPELISIIEPKNSRSINVAKRVGMHHWKDTAYNGIPVGIYVLRNFE